jgi:hypothetical protein
LRALKLIAATAMISIGKFDVMSIFIHPDDVDGLKAGRPLYLQFIHQLTSDLPCLVPCRVFGMQMVPFVA